MSLADQIAADVSQVFLNTADFAVSVTVTRRTQTTEPIAVIVGSSQFQVSNEFGFTQVETRDFSFDPSEYDFGDGAVLPERGDFVEDAGFRYVVTPPAAGLDFYKLDETRHLMTIHTTKTGSA